MEASQGKTNRNSRLKTSGPAPDPKSSEQDSGRKRTTQNVAINTGIAKRAGQRAAELNLSLNKYAEHAINYFNRFKLNPAVEHQVEDFPREINRLRDHLFGFMQTQERQYIIPLLKEMYSARDDARNFVTRLESMRESLSGIHQQLTSIYILLYKIKTIQDISLTSQYELSDQGEKEIAKLIAKNKRTFQAEIAHFEANLEADLSQNTDQ